MIDYKYAYYKTELGVMEIKYLNQTLYGLNFNVENHHQDQKTDFTDEVYMKINLYLHGEDPGFDLDIKFIGTDFQVRVWEKLANIPYGETVTYKDIALAINKPKAFRAVGQAINKNPISIIVPCHRVIGSSGKLVGYAGGLDMKKKLLDIEARK